MGHGTGYGGTGFKFDSEEADERKKQRKAAAAAAGLHEDNDDVFSSSDDEGAASQPLCVRCRAVGKLFCGTGRGSASAGFGRLMRPLYRA